MRTRTFGSTDRAVSVIGQGTWKLEADDRRQAVAALRAGLDLGMGHIDTAELYGSGKVEEIVGEAIAGRRREVFLVSKVVPTNASRKGTIAACERSLKRLGTDFLDVYLLHWPGGHPLADTVAAFEELVAAGKIRAWGVSNFDRDALTEVVQLAGMDVVACNQVLYHLEQRAIEHAVIPFCGRHGIAVVGYSPFGGGRFPKPASPAGEALAAVAREHSATPRQIALAFIVRQDGLFTIPKSGHPERVRENAAAAEIELTAEQVARLDAAFPVGSPRSLPTA